MGTVKRTRKITRTFLTGAALFLSHTKTAYAGINIKDASFSTNFVDLESGQFKISRTYDSRSTFNGLFGFGWCSNLDRRLLKNTETPDVAIETCGRRTVFKAIGERPTQRWSSGTQGYVEIDKGDFVHRTQDGRLIARYAGPDGGLSALSDPRGLDVPIQRGQPRRLLRSAASGEGLRVRLEVDPLANKILAIETSEARATYRYRADDLIEATNAWNNTYSFRYDSLHNLTEAQYPDKTSEEMSYDADHDRLLSFKGRNSCIERYEITIASKTDQRTQKTTAIKSCNEKESSRVAFEFDYRKKARGAWRLAKLKLSRDGRSNEINYDKGGDL